MSTSAEQQILRQCFWPLMGDSRSPYTTLLPWLASIFSPPPLPLLWKFSIYLTRHALRIPLFLMPPHLFQNFLFLSNPFKISSLTSYHLDMWINAFPLSKVIISTASSQKEENSYVVILQSLPWCCACTSQSHRIPGAVVMRWNSWFLLILCT